MSQIPRSQQLALKKKSDSPALKLFDVTSAAEKKQTNGSSTDDKQVIVIDDEYFAAIPVAREEIIEELLPPPVADPLTKKKRGRKPKHSTESRESDTSETSKGPSEVEEVTPESSPKSQPANKRQTRIERLQNASTIVNLSTTSEQSTTKILDDFSPSKSKVGGRRSTRPIDDIKFSYRSPENANLSMDATTNATIGSELGASMLETPIKRRAEDSAMDEGEESPTKRSRLDISALFSNFATPVSLLRNKFLRTNISSTPKVELTESNVSEEMKEVDLNAEEAKESDELKVIVTPIKKSLCAIM